MTIKARLNLIMGIVISFAIIVVTLAALRAYEEKVTIEQSLELNSLSTALSALIHETQKERGMSAGYLGSKGESFSSELLGQHTFTDSKYDELLQFINTLNFDNTDASLLQNINDLKKQFSSIGSIRTQVTQQKMSVVETLGFYNKINNTVLEIISLNARIAKTAELTKSISAYANFLKSKERAGLERAVLSNTFAADKFEDGMFVRWCRLMAEQDSFNEAYLALASENSKSFYQKTAQSSVFDDVIEMRQIAIDKAQSGGFGVNPQEWFATMTAKIDLLKEIDDAVSLPKNCTT